MLPNNGILKCNSCGYSNELDNTEEYKVSEEIEEHENVKMLGEVDDMRSTIKETCPECGHDEAYYELKQTRSADEAPTRILHVPNVNIPGEPITEVFLWKILKKRA